MAWREGPTRPIDLAVLDCSFGVNKTLPRKEQIRAGDKDSLSVVGGMLHSPLSVFLLTEKPSPVFNPQKFQRMIPLGHFNPAEREYTLYEEYEIHPETQRVILASAYTQLEQSMDYMSDPVQALHRRQQAFFANGLADRVLFEYNRQDEDNKRADIKDGFLSTDRYTQPGISLSPALPHHKMQDGSQAAWVAYLDLYGAILDYEDEGGKRFDLRRPFEAIPIAVSGSQSQDYEVVPGALQQSELPFVEAVIGDLVVAQSTDDIDPITRSQM